MISTRSTSLVCSAPCFRAKAALAIAASMLTGCATPARPRTELPAAASAATPVRPLNGEYDVTFHSTWFGPIHARMTAQPTPTGFKANTDPGVAWKMVGGVESVLGPVLAPFIFPQGMLLVWESTLPNPQTGAAGEGYIGISTVGPYRARTTMATADGPICIRFTDDRTIAAMTVTPAADHAATVDYAALTDSIERETTARLFDPSIAVSPAFREYFADLRAALPYVHDDISYLFAGGLAWRKRSTLPLPIAYRAGDASAVPMLNACSVPVEPLTVKLDNETRIVTIEALAFRDCRAVDAAFAAAIAQNPSAIILDITSCTGFDAAALRALSWLMPPDSAPIEAGTLFGAAQRTNPGEAEASIVDLIRPEDYDAADHILSQRGIVRLRVAPIPHAYTGPLAVCTLSRTRSSAEILAWCLKSRGRGMFIGQRTAGRPRVSREHEVGQGFIARIPEFDWLPPDGQPLTKGITPPVRATNENYIKIAKEKLVHPSSGADEGTK
ncbi:MAG: hypothetical protein JSR77_07785 [Planctomycetes bacterium]|nr:hypothetical protein [Planctomycetota bacterium]